MTIKIYETKIDRTGKTDGSTIMAGDFNTPLTIMNTTTRQKISREMGLKPHDKLTRSNRRIQNTSPNTTAHTVSPLKCTWDIF